MRTAYFLFVFVMPGSFLSFSQDYDRYYHKLCTQQDSVIDVAFSCNNYRAELNTEACLAVYDHWEWFYLMENKDSVLIAFRKMVTPVLGKYAADKIEIETITYYNSGDGIADSSDMAYLQEYGPDCIKLSREFTCYLMLDDSIWLPVNVLTDASGEILNPTDLPTILKTPQDFKLMPVCEIFEIAANDSYMQNEELKPYPALYYSSALKLFYYEFTTYSGVMLEETSNSWLSEHKHIFIDAQTGKILWRTTARHYEEHSGCVILMDVELPPSQLTGN